jgi:tRNA(Arg) A34 adenosine deaminase TadA
VPDSELATQLASNVATLSATHGQAPFSPHVTLATFPWAGESLTPAASVAAAVERALAAVLPAGGQTSLRVRGSQLATHPSLPFVTLVLLLERSEALLALRTAIFAQLEEPLRRVAPDPDAFPRCFPYMPHLSLMYDTRGSLSALGRERALERECEWGGVRGRSAFRGLEFDIGAVTLVETTSRDYSEWPVLGSVSVPTGLAAQTRSLVPLPADAVPPCPSRDEARFRREVLDRLDHALCLRLCFARAADSSAKAMSDSAGAATTAASAASATLVPTGAALVCDGQVAWSASGRVDPSTGEHVPAELTLLHEIGAFGSASSAQAAASSFFSRSHLSRMVLYCSCEPCPSSFDAIAASGIRSVVFGLSQLRLQQQLHATAAGLFAPSHSSAVAGSSSARLLLVGPLLEDEAAALVS